MENIARAIGRDLPISTKQSIEICNFIRGKALDRSKKILQNVIEKKFAIPFKRFNIDMGHKKDIAAGRYPIKSSKHILKLLSSAEANAQNKGLNIDLLFIESIIANKASTPYHFGRKRGIRMKRTHIELILKEKNDREKIHK